MSDEPKSVSHKQYLGDGAYVNTGSFRGEVVLTTEDGTPIPKNVVVLGPSELRLLSEWLKERGIKL